VPDAELQAPAALGPHFSPLYDSLVNGLPVKVWAERAA
jgi:hypothetical protein